MDIPLLRGRTVRETDDQNSARVAIINQLMAERFWPGQNPIGKHFGLKADPDHPLEVVGVVKNSRTENMVSPEGPFFYMPLAQSQQMPLTLQVRMAGDPESEAPAIIRLIESLEATMPLLEVRTMNEALNTPNGLLPFRWGAAFAMTLGVLGLILATVGLYGVISYVTSQRTHEIGIRTALGAQRVQIMGMVLRQGLLIVTLGTLVGVIGAYSMGKLVGHFLVGLTPTDPLTFIAVSLILIVVALVACYIPARRAAKVDPMVALRYE
jgi:predicted permease